jgi:membrane-associated phospholipid phosphatase
MIRRSSFFLGFCLSLAVVQAQQNLADSLGLTARTGVSRHKSAWETYRIPAALFVYGFVAYHSDPLLDFDDDLKRAIWDNNPHATTKMDNYLKFMPAVSVYALNLFGVRGANNFVDRSSIYVLSNIVFNALVLTIKPLAHRQRPNGEGYLSFPSGHTAEAFASAEFMRMEYKDVSGWYGVAGYVMAAATGFLRMYNDKHYFSDVVAGAAIGIASTDFSYWLYPKIKRLFVRKDHRNNFILPYYSGNSVGVSLVYHFDH